MAVLEANRVADSGGATLTVPPGTLIFHCGNTAPSGFLKANGATISRSTYADLFAALGTTFGAGDGSTTFTLPDMRGEFPRGWDDGRGIDSGRAFGVAQTDALQSHRHRLDNVEGSSAGSLNDTNILFGTNTGNTIYFTGGPIQVSGFSTPRLADETRPRNIALLACIKF
jgi:microcystin-dependent protein